jgi:hypothetical protein
LYFLLSMWSSCDIADRALLYKFGVIMFVFICCTVLQKKWSQIWKFILTVKKAFYAGSRALLWRNFIRIPSNNKAWFEREHPLQPVSIILTGISATSLKILLLWWWHDKMKTRFWMFVYFFSNRMKRCMVMDL